MWGSSATAGATTIIRRLLHILLEVERSRHVVTALAQLVGGMDAIIYVN
jgi:hypothetical protein